MSKGLLTIDNILIVGVAGGAGAYFLDVGGAKGIIDGLISEVMGGLKLPGGGDGNGNGGSTVDCTKTPDDPSCLGGGGGGGSTCDDPTCTSACCKCKCKDRTNCPDSGTCCDKCGDECPSQCAGGAAATLTSIDAPEQLQLPEPIGSGGLGPIAFGGYNFPDNNSFFDNDFDPVESSVSGFRPVMTQYVMPVPNTNTTMHTRQTSRKMEDGIKYHLG